MSVPQYLIRLCLYFRMLYYRLSRVVRERWKGLSSEGRAFYRRISEADHAQYDLFKSPEDRQRRRPLPEETSETPLTGECPHKRLKSLAWSI